MSAAPVARQLEAPEAVSGIQVAQGIGVQQAKGFWADAWSQVLRRPGAIAALVWLSIVGFFAAFAPLLASGHPLVYRLGADGGGEIVRSPFLENLTSGDAVIAIGTLAAVPWIFWRREGRAARLGAVIYGAVLAGIVVIGASFVQGRTDQRDISGWALSLRRMEHPEWPVAAVLGFFALALGMLIPAMGSWARRIGVPVFAVGLASVCVVLTWTRPLAVFDYIPQEVTGRATATYTLIPFSPAERFSAADRQPPGTTLGEAIEIGADKAPAHRVFWLGTDAFGQDVLAGLISAARLAISIGLVSTGIAVLIGVTMGAIMGYFGGWVDMVLFRVVEIFMAVPVLFLLIVAAAVLPEELRTTYTMMAIIGCFTWTTAARFTRAEFLKLRSQDFVQSAKAVGLPLPSLLFRHMLPNGVTPVLVDASFSIAAAIAVEATLSYLGLGPVDQPSWGKLLASAMSAEGQFKWWLAVFPGAAIFLTILSYNLVGEALRDAIDPKLKKARV
jgi:peptide/nickel transport system permease protein